MSKANQPSPTVTATPVGAAAEVNANGATAGLVAVAAIMIAL